MSISMLACTSTSMAEVTIDGSLGGINGTAVTSGNGFTYDIDQSYGQLSGQNLFHSFGQFNILINQQANFSGPANVANVVARITAGQSNIAGKITSSINNASLYLINPAGFIFTNGAVIDVDGNLNLSTADFLEFADGSQFFSNLSSVSTLSTGPISGFGFLTAGSGSISIDSSRDIPGTDQTEAHNLNVSSEFILIQDTELHASEIGIRMGDSAFGQIDINRSILESVEGGTFFQGGNIFAVDAIITASGRDSTIDIQANSVSLSGNIKQSVIQSGNIIASGGDIDIAANNISLSKAALRSSSGGNLGGGDINLAAATIVVENNSNIDLAAGIGSQAGDLAITTNDILIKDNSSLNTSGRFLDATAGTINIKATGRFGLEGNSVLLAESDSNSLGGSVAIDANSIVIRDFSNININSLGEGDSDQVDLKATTSLKIDQGSGISAVSNGQGRGGHVQLTGANISLDGMFIQGSANGAGTGGDIIISADQIDISNRTLINVSSFSTAANAGNAGSIQITGDTLNISDNATFKLISAGSGIGGTMNVNATNINLADVTIEAEAQGAGIGGEVSFQGEQINWSNTRVEASIQGDGAGGIIRLNGGDIQLSNSIVNISSRGAGNAGDLFVNANKFAMAAGGGIFGDTRQSGIGADIIINANQVNLDNISMTSGTKGSGQGGEIFITAKDNISLNDVFLNSQAEGQGLGGDIDLRTSNLLMTGTTNVNVSSFLDGDAGHIDIEPAATTLDITVRDSANFALAANGTGRAGLLNINASNVRFSDNAIIAASVSLAAEGDLVQFNVDSLIFEDNARVISDTRGSGQGGDIDIQSQSFQLLDNASLNAEALSSGDAGLIKITAVDVVIDGGKIITNSQLSIKGNETFGAGGRLRIDATNLSIINGGTLRSDAFSSGHGGDINLNADSFLLSRSQLSAETRGNGNGGTIEITANTINLANPDDVGFPEKILINVSALDGTGEAGQITIIGDEINIKNTDIALSSFTAGDAGLLNITASNNFTLDSSKILGESFAAGDGSNISVAANSLLLTNNSDIRSDAFSSGAGGDIELMAQVIDLNQSRLTAETMGNGAGGEINLNAETINLFNPEGTDQLAKTLINVSALAGTGEAGKIEMNATNINIDNASIALSTSTVGNAGTLSIIALENLNLTKAQIKGETTFVGQLAGEGSDIEITAADFLLDQSNIDTATRGSGEGGTVIFNSNNLHIIDSKINAETRAAGNAGIIDITAATLVLDSSTINTNAQTGNNGRVSTGSGGDIQITSSEISIINSAEIRSDAFSQGDGGNIAITAENFLLTGSRLTAETRGNGNGGLIAVAANTINIENPELITDSAIDSNAAPGNTANAGNLPGIDRILINVSAIEGTGNAGAITLAGDNINISNADMELSTFTQGEAGILTIKSANDIILVDANIFGETSFNDENGGEGSDIDIKATNLSFTNSTINSSSLGTGSGGDISLDGGHIQFTGESAISTDTQSSGSGGNIEITSPTLDLLDNSLISSSATGLADAGSIEFIVSDRLQVIQGNIQTTSAQSGGGNISIATQQVITIDQSIISASANGVRLDSGGGNIDIDPELFTLRQSQIVAQANVGSGGNINLEAINFVADTESLISASSARGIDGSVAIESPNQSVNPTSMNLYTGIQDFPDFISTNCISPDQKNSSFLVVDNLNPIRRNPNDFLPVLSAPSTPSTHLAHSALTTPATPLSIHFNVALDSALGPELTASQHKLGSWRPGC
ncbi:MAG: filamentous hemagglutinin N-terminal domain-containing protein [Pseudomonadales bacterium]|nr:filamentous hemagglutinin N-terminal domain-containing protein [Pseudomonadales bacterium]